MALYKILGVDQQEYGPVVAEQICRWIAERRVTASTLTQLGGSADWQPISAVPEFADALRRVSPPVVASYAPQPSTETGEHAIGQIIPFKNPKAIWAYYLGIFSFIPGLGILSGFAAMVLGIQGLLLAHKNPGARGHVHAWVGILAGVVFCLAQITVLLVLLGAGFLAGR